MYDELVKRLRELASIPEHCENVADCDQCSKEDICLSFTNKRIIEVATQAADAIEELSKPKWIPTTERLPELNVACLVYNKYYGPMVGWRIDGERFRIPGSRFPDHPTHWMSLAKPPKEE